MDPETVSQAEAQDQQEPERLNVDLGSKLEDVDLDRPAIARYCAGAGDGYGGD